MGAAERGWGPGWPNCQGSKMVRVTAGGVSVNVHREIARLVERGLQRTRETGYVMKQDQTGAFVCRPIGGTTRPSNHSWGLAIDINWRENPFTHNANAPRTITPAVVAIWKNLGFSWGGDWSGKKDFMHFEFLGTPAAAARRTAALGDTAAAAVRTTPTPTPERFPMALTDQEQEALRKQVADIHHAVAEMQGRLANSVDADLDPIKERVASIEAKLDQLLARQT